MAIEQTERPPKRNRRFARLPHDVATERIATAWSADVEPIEALRLLLPEIEKGAFLSHGKYNDRYVASLTREEEKPEGFCDCVTGWGGTPAAAFVDLSFRWTVLCKESWWTATHAKLISEIGKVSNADTNV